MIWIFGGLVLVLIPLVGLIWAGAGAVILIVVGFFGLVVYTSQPNPAMEATQKQILADGQTQIDYYDRKNAQWEAYNRAYWHENKPKRAEKWKRCARDPYCTDDPAQGDTK